MISHKSSAVNILKKYQFVCVDEVTDKLSSKTIDWEKKKEGERKTEQQQQQNVATMESGYRGDQIYSAVSPLSFGSQTSIYLARATL